MTTRPKHALQRTAAGRRGGPRRASWPLSLSLGRQDTVRALQFSPAILAVLATMLAGCSRGPVVSVTNRSSVAISNAVVSGPLFTNALGTLQRGEERSVVVHPRGESHVRLTFEADGRKFDSGGLEYFEESSMYRVSLTVTTNLQVESSSTIKHY